MITVNFDIEEINVVKEALEHWDEELEWYASQEQGIPFNKETLDNIIETLEIIKRVHDKLE